MGGDGVVINGKSCFHRAPTPQKYTVTFCSYVEEIKSSISYASIEEDLNGNTDDINEPNTEDRDQRNEFSIHSTEDDNEIHKSNKFIKKQNSIDIIRNSNIKSYASEDGNPRKEFSTDNAQISSEIHKSNKNFKKQNSVEILRNPGVKRYAYSHNYKSMDELSDDEDPDDEHPKEYVNKKELRRGSLASAISNASAEVRRGSLASVVDGASTVGAGCFTVLVAHLFMKKFV